MRKSIFENGVSMVFPCPNQNDEIDRIYNVVKIARNLEHNNKQ
ncbi:hypothetical protein [Elizabethkingia meningoseptica]